MTTEKQTLERQVVGSDLDIQTAYEAWIQRTIGARAPITAFYAGYRAALAAISKPIPEVSAARAPSSGPSSRAHSEIDTDGRHEQGNRDLNRQSGEGREIGGRGSFFASGLQRSERDVCCEDSSNDRQVTDGGGLEPPYASQSVGPFSDVAGFGASYQRQGNEWVIYTMPGAKRIGSIDGYDKARLDWVVEALRAAHAQGSAFSSWVPPTGTKRAIVKELRKARSNFMINDFEIADRMVEAIRRLAAEEATDNTPPPSPQTITSEGQK